MNSWGSTGITAVILLISFLLIGITVASVITGETGVDVTTEEDIEQMLDDVLEEITTYIQIKDKIGKYYGVDGQLRIEKVAIMIKPLIKQNINISELTIKLCNGNNVKILGYSGNAEYIESNPLFEHPIWSDTTTNDYSFIVTLDRDRSLVDYDVLNGDMAYIIIKLSEDFSMVKGDSLIVTLFPSSGLARTTTLEAPLPMNRVISFE